MEFGCITVGSGAVSGGLWKQQSSGSQRTATSRWWAAFEFPQQLQTIFSSRHSFHIQQFIGCDFWSQALLWLQSLQKKTRRNWMVPVWSEGKNVLIREPKSVTFFTFFQGGGAGGREQNIDNGEGSTLSDAAMLRFGRAACRAACAWWRVSSTWAQTSPGAASLWWWSWTGRASLPGPQSARRGASLTSGSGPPSQEVVGAHWRHSVCPAVQQVGWFSLNNGCVLFFLR